MRDSGEKDLGRQPISDVMASRGIEARDIVAASTEQITFKMISRAAKGRRLTPNVQRKILTALNKAVGGSYSLKDLFSY